MISSTSPGFPLYSQQTFIEYLQGGGTIAAIVRYLVRVEHALRPRTPDQKIPGGYLRDVATLVLLELAKNEAVELERRIHQAVQERQVVLDDWDRLIDEFGERMATAVRCISAAAAMLVDTNVEQVFSRRLQFPQPVCMRWSERWSLLNRITQLKHGVDSMLVQTNPDIRRDEIERLLEKAGDITTAVEALKTCTGKLRSQFNYNDQPRKYGVVRTGRYAEFLATLRDAEAVWNEKDRLALDESRRTLLERFKEADTRSGDISTLPGDLLNWLGERQDVNKSVMRPKAGDRAAAMPVDHTG